MAGKADLVNSIVDSVEGIFPAALEAEAPPQTRTRRTPACSPRRPPGRRSDGRPADG